MKIAFPTSGDSLDAPLNSTFGRAPQFLVYDLEKKNFTIADNKPNLNAAQGAGIQAAQTLIRFGAQCLVSGHCGPKAFRVLSAAGIKVFYTKAPSVAAALSEYVSGELTEARSADVQGHNI